MTARSVSDGTAEQNFGNPARLVAISGDGIGDCRAFRQQPKPLGFDHGFVGRHYFGEQDPWVKWLPLRLPKGLRNIGKATLKIPALHGDSGEKAQNF